MYHPPQPLPIKAEPENRENFSSVRRVFYKSILHTFLVSKSDNAFWETGNTSDSKIGKMS